MKAIVNKNNGSARPFPKLMIQIEGESRGPVILMIDDGKGIVIVPSTERPIGEDSGFDEKHRWHMDSFKDFEGTVTLSND